MKILSLLEFATLSVCASDFPMDKWMNPNMNALNKHIKSDAIEFEVIQNEKLEITPLSAHGYYSTYLGTTDASKFDSLQIDYSVSHQKATFKVELLFVNVRGFYDDSSIVIDVRSETDPLNGVLNIRLEEIARQFHIDLNYFEKLNGISLVKFAFDESAKYVYAISNIGFSLPTQSPPYSDLSE